MGEKEERKREIKVFVTLTFLSFFPHCYTLLVAVCFCPFFLSFKLIFVSIIIAIAIATRSINLAKNDTLGGIILV